MVEKDKKQVLKCTWGKRSNTITQYYDFNEDEETPPTDKNQTKGTKKVAIYCVLCLITVCYKEKCAMQIIYILCMVTVKKSIHRR